MSYSICYQRQFIKSGLGITPCFETAESNVWCGAGRYQKRPRSWSIFLNQLAVSEDALMAEAKKYLGSNEHWRTASGKWVDDAAFIRPLRSLLCTPADPGTADYGSRYFVYPGYVGQ